MAAPSLTYTLTNGATADASQVMQNFNDLLNGISDGTKDLSINALTVAGTATLNGHVNLGNSSADDLTITASLAASLPVKTNTSFDIGSTTKGLQSLYLGGTSTFTGQVKSATLTAARVWTIPETAADASFVMTKLAQTINGAKTLLDGVVFGGGTTNLNYYHTSTWTPVATYAGGASGATTVNNAVYTRVGNMVFVAMDILWLKGTGTGAFTVTGLPFNATAATKNSLAVSYLAFVTMASSLTLSAQPTSGGTAINFYTKLADGTATDMGTASATQFASTGTNMRLMLSGFYITSD